MHTNLYDEFVRFFGKKTDHLYLSNPAEFEKRNLREAMRYRAESELLPLQEIAQQEVRQGLLTAEALAVLPNKRNVAMILIFHARLMH